MFSFYSWNKTNIRREKGLDAIVINKRRSEDGRKGTDQQRAAYGGGAPPARRLDILSGPAVQQRTVAAWPVICGGAQVGRSSSSLGKRRRRRREPQPPYSAGHEWSPGSHEWSSASTGEAAGARPRSGQDLLQELVKEGLGAGRGSREGGCACGGEAALAEVACRRR